MHIPDIGGILDIQIRDVGMRKTIICPDLDTALAILHEFIASEPSAKVHKVVAVYSPHPFQIGE